MKKIIYIIVCVFISSQSFSQKCKEVIDPITNEKKYEFRSKPNSNGLAAYGEFSYEINKGVISLTKEFYYGGAIYKSVPAGSEIYFKLENDEILKLKTSKETIPKIYGGVSILSGYRFVLILTKSDLNKLAVSPVVLMRIPKITDEGYLDLDKKHIHVKKSKGDLMKGAACMSAYL